MHLLKELIKKFIKPAFFIYLLIGGLSALFYFSILMIGIEVFNWHYRLVLTIAYLLTVGFHFFANRKYTFLLINNQFMLPQLMRYICVLLGNYLITLGVVSFMVNKLSCSIYIGAGLAIALTVLVGYLALKYWVFRERGSLCE